jgi:hypothetical protein
MDLADDRPTGSESSSSRTRAVRSCIGVLVMAALLVIAASGTAGATRSGTAPKPSKKAEMVCAKEAQREIAGVLGIKPTRVTQPTWVDQLYSCTYRYSSGSFTVSVKQLADRPTTVAYFDSLGTTLSRLPDDVPLGDRAFLTANGTMTVRKDNDVLEVDASKLPPQFSKLHLSPSDVASSVAMTILGCWKG